MIYLIRHGEAAAGWGDHPDPGLSDLGKQQAAVAAATLIDQSARYALTSPMQRCRETAQVFEREARLSARIEPAVSEIATPPDLEDRVSWLREVMSGTWTEAGRDIANWRRQAIKTVLAQPDHTAIFSHFIAINAVVSALEGSDDTIVFRPNHCSITRLERQDGKWVVAERGSEAETQVL